MRTSHGPSHMAPCLLSLDISFVLLPSLHNVLRLFLAFGGFAAWSHRCCFTVLQRTPKKPPQRRKHFPAPENIFHLGSISNNISDF
jgi:hypothetical protein